MNRQPKTRTDLGALADLAPQVAETLASAMGDVALVVDPNGIISKVAFAGTEPVTASVDDWVGRKWVDTVTAETREKVELLLKEVAASGVSRLRQVNHPSPAGPDIPVAYSAVRLGERGPVLVVGRDLRTISAIQRRLVETQQAMERDYWQMRQAETRYRLLFQIATDAVLVVDAGTLRVVDANAAAGRLFDLAPDKLVGKPATAGLDRASHAAVEQMFASARATGRPGEVGARLAVGRGEARVTATPFRSEGATLLLVRVRAPAGGGRESALPEVPLAALFERIPDAIVLTGEDGRVRSANPAFLDLAQLANEEQARGRSLGEWIGRPGSDLDMILGIVRKHGVARPLATSVRGEHGQAMEVELSAAAVRAGERQYVGFVIRGVERRMAAGARGAQDLAVAVQQLTGLVGRVSLPDLVRDTTDLVERHLIRAALEITGDNRTSAAEMLGVSRQSLYVKLRRHGFQSDEAEPAEIAGSAGK